VTVNVAAVPFHPSGNRIEIYGRDGAIVIRAGGSFNIGPSEVSAGKGKGAMAPMPVPAKYRLAPDGTPAGQPYNVAQAYARSADALRAGHGFDVDFDLAVQRHALIDAIERSSATGRSVKVGGSRAASAPPALPRRAGTALGRAAGGRRDQPRGRGRAAMRTA
jgi:predicted dehydrogenase